MEKNRKGEEEARGVKSRTNGEERKNERRRVEREFVGEKQ